MSTRFDRFRDPVRAAFKWLSVLALYLFSFFCIVFLGIKLGWI